MCLAGRREEYDRICQARERARDHRTRGGVPSLFDLSRESLLDAVISSLAESTPSPTDPPPPTPWEQNGDEMRLVVEEEEDEGDSECCICYVEEPHRRAQFTSCSHWVCTTCAERIMLWGGLCPLCRCLVVGLDVPERVEEGTELLRLCPRQERGWYVGVKMEDEPGGHVRVCWTHPADLARRYGIRAGDVILRVNGVAAKSHRVVKAIMDRVTEEEGESALLLEVRKGPRRRRGVGSLLACTARVSTAA